MDEPAPLVVSPAAIHEGVYGEERERVEMFRAAFSEEPRVASIDRRATDADLIHLIDGASIAINDLLHMYMQAGNIPRVLSERRFPLCDIGASTQISSLFWTDWDIHCPIPHRFAVREVVEALTHCLQLSNEVLVTAVVVFEKFIRVDPSIVRVYTMRPMLIGACLIALKHNDDFVDTRRCWRRLRRVFDDLEFDHLLGIEEKLLKLIDYRLPMGIIYQTYAEALCLVANDAKGVNRAAPIVLADEYWD